ncbi:hypothetical protein AMS68_007904 [Peltaster fructicola]|uniref:Uncharacterized protein n=1 Tax=Peltaster fructicola TaxID=286661 RepID=A0A6H0Y5R0_9PEZI|nr:hypothetical protein AMS68_007904 [Peltaster fructicola]
MPNGKERKSKADREELDCEQPQGEVHAAASRAAATASSCAVSAPRASQGSSRLSKDGVGQPSSSSATSIGSELGNTQQTRREISRSSGDGAYQATGSTRAQHVEDHLAQVGAQFVNHAQGHPVHEPRHSVEPAAPVDASNSASTTHNDVPARDVTASSGHQSDEGQPNHSSVPRTPGNLPTGSECRFDPDSAEQPRNYY